MENSFRDVPKMKKTTWDWSFLTDKKSFRKIGFVGIEISSIVILSVNVSNKTHHQLHGFYLVEVGLYKWPSKVLLDIFWLIIFQYGLIFHL